MLLSAHITSYGHVLINGSLCESSRYLDEWRNLQKLISPTNRRPIAVQVSRKISSQGQDGSPPANYKIEPLSFSAGHCIQTQYPSVSTLLLLYQLTAVMYALVITFFIISMYFLISNVVHIFVVRGLIRLPSYLEMSQVGWDFHFLYLYPPSWHDHND